MSLFSITRPADGSPLRRTRSSDDPKPLSTVQDEVPPPLPRHLLVTLAGITADVTTLQQRNVDAPQTHAALGAILGRLDGLVDSIYGRAADPGGRLDAWSPHEAAIDHGRRQPWESESESEHSS